MGKLRLLISVAGLVGISIGFADRAFGEEKNITSVARDGEGDITHICGGSEDWSPRSYLDAILDIQVEEHSYFVDVNGSPRVAVEVWGMPERPFLKTVPDGSLRNNLDNLLDC